MLKGQDWSRFGQDLVKIWSRLVKIGQVRSKFGQTQTDQSWVNKVCNQKFVRFGLESFNFRIFESYVNKVERYGRISEFPKFYQSLPLQSLQIWNLPTSRSSLYPTLYVSQIRSKPLLIPVDYYFGLEYMLLGKWGSQKLNLT